MSTCVIFDIFHHNYHLHSAVGVPPRVEVKNMRQQLVQLCQEENTPAQVSEKFKLRERKNPAEIGNPSK